MRSDQRPVYYKLLKLQNQAEENSHSPVRVGLLRLGSQFLQTWRKEHLPCDDLEKSPGGHDKPENEDTAGEDLLQVSIDPDLNRISLIDIPS